MYAKRVKLQSDYDLLSTDKTECLLRRTKGTYYEYGEKASCLLTLQLKHQSASNVTNLRLFSLPNPAEIHSIFTSFYSNLYQSEPPANKTTMFNFLDTIYIPGIDLHIKEEAERPIQLDELFSCLKLMQHNKALGLDGLPVDF